MSQSVPRFRRYRPKELIPIGFAAGVVGLAIAIVLEPAQWLRHVLIYFAGSWLIGLIALAIYPDASRWSRFLAARRLPDDAIIVSRRRLGVASALAVLLVVLFGLTALWTRLLDLGYARYLVVTGAIMTGPLVFGSLAEENKVSRFESKFGPLYTQRRNPLSAWNDLYVRIRG
jgi:hypothetical protein